MISASLSSSSVRSLASSQSITSFAQGLASAPRLAEVANTAAAARSARRRAHADNLFPSIATTTPAPVPASLPSSSSISSMSSTKSFKSFAKDLAITRRLADLNVAGQQARTCRGRRARAATFGRSTVSLVPSSSTSLRPPLPLNASTVTFGRRALLDRPLVEKPSVAAAETVAPKRLFSGNAPEAFTKLSPEEQLAWREYLVGKPAEKPKGVQKLLQAFKRP